MSETDDFWERKFREREQRAGVNTTAQGRDPQAAARAQRYANLLGITPALAEAQPEVTERMVEAQRTRATLAQNPWMTGPLQDPDLAALMGKDDLERLGNIVSGLTGAPTGKSTLPSAPPKSLIDSTLSAVGVRAPTVLPEIEVAARRTNDGITYATRTGYERNPASAVPGALQGQIVANFFASAMGGLARSFAGASRAAADGLGLEGDGFFGDGEDFNKRLEGTADFLQTYYRPDTGNNWLGERLLDTGQMVTDMAVGGGLAGKALAGYFAATTGAQSYSKFASRSDDKGEAALGAGIDATAEYVFEKGPTGALVNLFGGKYVKGLVAEYIKREVVGEALTGGVQYSTDTLLADPTQDFSVKGLGQAVIDSAAVAVLGGAAIGTLGIAYNREQARTAMAAQDALQAVIAQAALDAQMDQAATSPLRTNAPEAFARMIEEGARTSPVRDVYIPVAAIDEALADETLPAEEREALVLYQSQIDEARAAQGDVVIPIGDAMAKLAGTKLWQRLSEDARVVPGGMSGREAREKRDQIVAELEAAGEAEIKTADQQEQTGRPSEAAGDAVSSKQQVYNEVKSQMVAAGRTVAEAQTTAAILASRMETLASTRYGQFPDAMAAWKASGISIVGPRGAQPAKGKTLKAKGRKVEQRLIYRGTNGSSERITGGIGEGLLFAAESEDYARLYGDNIEQIGVRPEAKILKDGTAEFRKVTGRKGNSLFRSLRKGESFREGSNDAIEKARTAGYDAVDLGGENGIAIINEAAFVRQVDDVFSSEGDGTGAGVEGERTVQQGPRGQTAFATDGSTVIQLFAKADFSTMLHEMSHVFLEQEFQFAASDAASPELKADVETISKWFAANGHPIGADGMIPTEAHELFARTGERYFREGKAPSAELRTVFAQLREWLKSIYQTVAALEQPYGKAPINHEIRAVFDRIIATDEAIEANATTPMSREDLGMTEAAYAAYLKSVRTTRDEAHDALLEKLMAGIRRRETEKGRAEARAVRDEVRAEVNTRPEFVALHLLRTGKWLGDPSREAVPVKLNTGWLIDNYGEDVLDRLPNGVLKLHRGDGVVGDVVAEITGFSSGDALVRSLLAMRVQSDLLRANGEQRSLRETVVEAAVEKALAQRHGDPGMTEAQIREEALAALNSDRQGEVLSGELRSLKRRENKGGLVTPYQLLKEWARRKVGEGRVSEVVSKAALQRYIRGYNRARTAFEEAILAGDISESVKQKQAQMINHALLAEGKRKAEEVGAIVKRLKKLAERETMASVDQDYMDRIHELLAGYSFRAVSQAQLAERASFEEWAAAERAKGQEVLVPPRFLDGRQNWSEATVAKLIELDQMVASLLHLGKFKQKLRDGKALRDYNELADDSRARILTLPERTAPQLSIGEDDARFGENVRAMKFGRAFRNLVSRRGMRQGASELMKIETLFDTADGDKTGTGPLNTVLTKGATRAANTFASLMDEVMQPLVDVYQQIGTKHRARLNDTVTITELALRVSIDKADEERLGQPLRVTRMQHIAMLMNTGNLSNLSKMVAGEKWGNPDSATDLARVRDVLWSYASAEDAALVKALGAGVGKLWPHIARVEREMTGVVPEAVEAMPFATAHGEMPGWYWPVVWDSARSQMGKEQADANDFFGIGIGVSTPVGHTITRTGAAAPMEYGLEQVLFSHLNRVISRVAYAEWVRDALKVTGSGRIMGALSLRLGREYSGQIEPWIKDQIPSTAVPPIGSKLIEKVLNQFRLNASLCALGLSYTTAVAQTLGLAYSAGIVGEGSKTDGMKYMALGFYAMLKHSAAGLGGGPNSASYNPFAGAQEFVFTRSEEMKRRARELNQETADAFRVLRDHDTAINRARALAFRHIGAIDLYMVSMPTWLGAYAKGIDTGLTEEEAAGYAEKAVRLSQGSGRAKDLSVVQRGNAGQKLIAMFYTPGSVFFNQQWDATQQMKAGNYSAAIMPTIWFLALSTIFDAFREGDWPDDDEDSDGRIDEIASWALRNMLFGATFGIPLVRDAANFAERQIRGEYAEIGQTPISMVLGGGYDAGRAAYKVATKEEGEQVEGREVKKIAVGAGFIFGLPGVQIGRTAGFLTDVSTGAIEPEGAYDWYSGLTYGKLPERDEAE